MTRPEPPPDVAVLQGVLAAEHAVVYGYGVAGARLGAAGQRRAERVWNRHRGRRDELAVLLRRLGAEPVQTSPAYDLPAPVDSPASARRLLALLEERMAAVWADAVLNLSRSRRRLAVEGLRDAAVAAAGWRGSSVAFPGLAERATPGRT